MILGSQLRFIGSLFVGLLISVAVLFAIALQWFGTDEETLVIVMPIIASVLIFKYFSRRSPRRAH